MRAAALLAFAMTTACAAEGAPFEPIDLDAIEFHVCGPDMGIHPDDSVLADADNPFADAIISDDGKWAIQTRASGVAAFYAWATLHARAPSGEAQFYAALNLQLVYERELAPADELAWVRNQAIRGYQAVLDDFPDSVTWDASGTVAYDLATMAYKGIVSLDAVPDGWILVPTADGGERAIPAP